ncbi:MAG: NAD(P)-dependent alcohol dehydrogenase [Acidobacteria bacterium]|nr:NAD(P)-dependent alcohol dehydrogenase [Acidobacteriota bacterium]
MTIRGQAVYTAGQRLRPFSYEPADLGPFDIEIHVRYCGICHSDIHLIDNDWNWSAYPFIPGHEIIGNVTRLGNMVTHVKVGQRVGVGWQCGSCLQCEWCIRGEENLCAHSVATCVSRNGGFAEAVCVDSRFAFAIPDILESASTAPILCGGITVYSPLRHLGVKPWSKVGVVGIGGLGHLAIKFADAFGAEVTAFSTSPDKEEESRRLGADHFILSKDPDQMAKAASSFDFILATPHTDLDWAAYLNALRPMGTLCLLGAPPAALLNIPPILLLLQKKTICGSIIGNRSTIREMLEFAARHRIGATVEVVPLAEVNAAIDKVRANKARYRMVLEV